MNHHRYPLSSPWLFVLLLTSTLGYTGRCLSQEDADSIKQIANRVRDSIVVVSTGEQGREAGMGAGFVVDPRGLIATSLHVIRQARPIWVQLRDETRYRVTEVHASDRNFDLAILRIEPKAPLTPLRLGTGELESGDLALAIGHPLGLKHSVVTGMVAGERDFDGLDMWQVAMAIEPGNSGGPLLDRDGRVQGVVTLKSVGESFGFAVKVELLRKLIDSPNPTSMDHWPASIRLNVKDWTPKMGARWTQQGGRILVDSPGRGFGGRSLLLRADEPPELPFELAVAVKLQDESGAAGLVFHSDGGERHYGFYPSNGNLRITQFNGPSVFTWEVLRDESSEAYRPGDWNELRLRVERKQIQAFVNDQLFATINSPKLPPGKMGLCKFRDTRAEFRNFRFGKSVPSWEPNAADVAALRDRLQDLPSRDDWSDGTLRELSEQQREIGKYIRSLETRMEQMKQLQTDVHVALVCQQLSELTAGADAEIDLLAATLWISKLDNPDLEVDAYLKWADEIAAEVRTQFPEQATSSQKRKTLDEFLFAQSGYHGSRLEYYDISNSHIDRVMEDREGIPITLSIFYMAIAKRLDLDVAGVSLPGHFVVRYKTLREVNSDEEGSGPLGQLVDVFHGGVDITRDEANIIAIRTSGRPATDDSFAAAQNLDILERVLTNMRSIAQSRQDTERLLRYVEALAAIRPQDHAYRGLRGILRYQVGRKAAAREDFDWLLERPDEVDPGQLQQLRQIRARMD